MAKPNFFIVGAPKCGTTALYEYLRGHPNIFMPQLKEPHFFASDMHERRSYYTKTAKEYFALFGGVTDNHTAIGEGSVWYIYSCAYLKKLRQFNEAAKIILMLRNPVEMIYSLHSQMLYSFTETRSDFEVAWRENNLPERRPSPAVDTYADVGKFSSCVERLFSIFPKQQIKIILFDDFKKSTKQVYENVLRFLTVNSDHRKYFPIINQHRKIRLRTLGKFTQNPPRFLWLSYRFANNLFGERLEKVIKNIMRYNEVIVKRKPIPPELREDIVKEFSEDIDKLSILIKKNLSHWKS